MEKAPADQHVTVRLLSTDGKTTVDVEVSGINDEIYRAISDQLHAALVHAPARAYTAVGDAMLEAVRLCPFANPADLWVHLIYHQFRTRLLRSDQSWKRVGGDALEYVLIRTYQGRLRPHDIHMRRSKRADAEIFGLTALGLGRAKTDIVLEGFLNEKWHLFGALHVKASIAERLNDDAPASAALLRQGIWSGMATMDCKMFPPPHGDAVVYGELHGAKGDKRGYFEVAGQFSGCYSFNLRTPPSGETTQSGVKIYSMRLCDPQPDALVTDIVRAWETRKPQLAKTGP